MSFLKLGAGSAHRRDGDRIAPAASRRDFRTGREGAEISRQAEAHVDELATHAGDRHVGRLQIGVGVEESLLDGAGRQALRLLRRLKHRGDGDVVADVADRREIGARAKPRAGPMLAIFVTGETGGRIEAARGRKLRLGGVGEAAVLGIGTAAIVGPQAVHDKTRAGACGALLRGFFVAAEVAETRRPRQRHHIEVEGRRRRGRRALRRDGRRARQRQNERVREPPQRPHGAHGGARLQ